MTRLIILLTLSLGHAPSASAQTYSKFVQDFEVELAYGRGCFYGNDMRCAIKVFQDVFLTEDHIRLLANTDTDRLCSFFRENDEAVSKFIGNQTPETKLSQIRDYEDLMKRLTRFQVSETVLDCVKSSRETTGPYLLLERARSCFLLTQEDCMVDALVELALFEGQFNWQDVGAHVGIESSWMQRSFSLLRSEHLWTVETRKREILSDRFELGFFNWE